MKDRLGREIDYVRISLTDRCNFNCVYCAAGSVLRIPKEMMMSFEEIELVVKVMSELGIKHVRLTGGEPLLRKDIETLIEKIRKIDSIETIGLTTNGYYLEEKAESIFKAGLDSINVSLDSLDEKSFYEITKGGDLKKVLKGLDKVAIIKPDKIKINTVITKYLPQELLRFLNFAKKNNFILRFIELMPVEGINFKDIYVPVSIIEEKLKDISPVELVSGKFGNGPAKYYRVKDMGIEVGIIAAISHKFCDKCNRIRLSSNGVLFSCLNSAVGVNIKDLLKNGDRETLNSVIKETIYDKPISHNFTKESIHFNMCKLGG